MESGGQGALEKMAAAGLFVLIITQLATSSVSLSTETSAAVIEEVGGKRLPIVVSTWPFVEAVRAAWEVVNRGGTPVDAVVAGCSTCERLRCDGAVGYGGSPDESGETTLDAMIMDGTTMDVGAVGALRSVRDAIGAARLVMDHTDHTLLVGKQASQFAISMGLSSSNLSTDDSLNLWSSWREIECQPNFWRDVVPEASRSCGPYGPQSKPRRHSRLQEQRGETRGSSLKGIGRTSHDTISMAVINEVNAFGNVAAGASTNGVRHKIPGRVGDTPIVGASAYAEDDVGACGATGDGDVMMRFLPCYQIVESMRQGWSPKDAVTDAVARIKRRFPLFIGAVIAVDRHGNHAGASNGWIFHYTVWGHGMEQPEIFTVYPQ